MAYDNIYKNSLAPEDKFDYANFDPEYTEPIKDFPSVVRFKRLAEHWRDDVLTSAAGAMRAKTNTKNHQSSELLPNFPHRSPTRTSPFSVL